MTRLIIVLLALSPLALAVPAFMTERSDGELNPLAPATPLEPLAPRTPGRVTVQEIRPITGFAINAHHIVDLSLYVEAVDRIAELGANGLIVLTPMMQAYVDSNEMIDKPEKCATDEQLVAILQRGREKGLHTTLLPIVLLEHPGEKDWRGVIRPQDWDQWWRAYDAFTDRFVNIANRAEVDLLVIGSELNSTEAMLGRWERVVERVREEFKGQIAYSSNWDRYDKHELWKLVDVICVSSYFELERDDPNASEAQLVEAWTKEREALVKFARKKKQPLLLSEVGYPSVPWASAHPWNYVTEKGAEADHQAQAKCWRAFFRAWTETFRDPKSQAAGFFGYFWSPYYHGDAWDTGYGIKGKPAYHVVKDGFARIRGPAEADDDDDDRKGGADAAR